MNKDFFKSSNPSRFHSLRDTRPEPTTWQVLFKEITNSTHTTATRHYRAHLATLSDIEATGDAQQLEQWKLTKSNMKNAQPAFIPSILLAYELFGGVGLELIALGCGVCYMLSGTHGLYSSQLFVTEKLLSEYTESWGKRLRK